MNIKSLAQDIQDLKNAVHREGYYVSLWKKSLEKLNMTEAGIDAHEYDNGKVISLANAFWMIIPDSPQIRRTPFSLLCYIAEHMFDQEP